jgi:hypothetical protein
VEAQRPLILVGGPVFASTDHENASSKTGLFVAAGTSFAINERFSIDPFVGFVQKGARFEGGDFDENINVLEIPVFLSGNFPVNETVAISLGAGPQISLIISCEYEEEGFDSEDCDDAGDEVKSFEFGFILNGNVSFPITDSLMGAVGAAADFGLTDLFEDFDEKSRTYFLYASVAIPLGGM